MNVPREILAALALGPLLGAIGSGLVGTEPRQIRTGQPESFAEDELALFTPRHTSTLDNPEHYPLITPRGRIEVAELSMHGLYRNLRSEPLFEDGWPEPRYAVETALIDDGFAPDPQLEAVLAEAEAESRRMTEADETRGERQRVSRAEDAQADRPRGSPRSIHIATELGRSRQPDPNR